MSTNNELKRKCIDMERRTRSSSSAARNHEKKGSSSRKAELMQEKHLQMKERFQDAMRKKDQELAIAQSIVHQHGGLIECESVAGHTKFQIQIPLETEND